MMQNKKIKPILRLSHCLALPNVRPSPACSISHHPAALSHPPTLQVSPLPSNLGAAASRYPPAQQNQAPQTQQQEQLPQPQQQPSMSSKLPRWPADSTGDTAAPSLLNIKEHPHSSTQDRQHQGAPSLLNIKVPKNEGQDKGSDHTLTNTAATDAAGAGNTHTSGTTTTAPTAAQQGGGNAQGGGLSRQSSLPKPPGTAAASPPTTPALK